MLHIVLLVLKILLITLLILLGVALVLVLLILFAPISYKLYAEKHDDFICKLKASWLGFVFCLKATYDEQGFIYRIKSFGGTLISNVDGKQEKDSEKAEKKKSGKQKEKTDQESSVNKDTVKETETKALAEDVKETGTNTLTEGAEETGTNTLKQADEAVDDEMETGRSFADDESEFKQKTKSILVKVGKLLDKLVFAVKAKIEQLVSRVTFLKSKVELYKRFLKASTTKKAWQVVRKYLIKLLRHINPKKIRGSLTYGTGDPASTGMQLGYISVALPLYYKKIDITPDFSRKILDGDLLIKGRIRVYNILYYACRIYFNKYVKKTIERYKKISGGNE